MDLAARLNRTQKSRPAGNAAAAPGAQPVAAPQASAAQELPPFASAGPQAAEPRTPSTDVQSVKYYEIKTAVHDRLVNLLDLSLLETLGEAEINAEIARLVESILREEYSHAPLNAGERSRLIHEIRDEVLGLGPLEPFIQDPTVSDILVNSYRQIYVERRGRLELAGARFQDNDHLRKIIDRIVSKVGRRVDESQPMVDARLEDGSRVNAIIPPLAIDGPSLSIRKFSRDPLELEDLIAFGALTPELGQTMRAIVKGRMNVLISGGTGSGKTTLLNVLSRFIPSDERIVTIEDAAELQLKQDHVVRLETRPVNIEGRGEVTQRDLVKNCLRMRPDRIILGECRSSEALDMLQAMNTGHDGSLTTIHANSPRDALMRLETMVSMAGMNISQESMRRYIASAVDVIIQAKRLMDGTRKITSFQEIMGMEGDMITMQEIFAFEQTGVTGRGGVSGRFISRGIRPKFSERLHARGIDLDERLFGQRVLASVGGES
ncbi:MAG: CpaF family protein [Desulfovibrionaceae bacterium]